MKRILLFITVALLGWSVAYASGQEKQGKLDFLYQKGSTRGLGTSLKIAGKAGPTVVLDFAFAPRMEKQMTVRLGGIRPSGVEAPALKPVVSKFGGGYQGAGFALNVSQLYPGTMVESTA